MRTHRHLLVLAGLACLLAQPPTAWAQGGVPGLSISFVQQFGTGTTTDAFPIWMRLTLDPGAPALHFDGAAPPDFGLPAGTVPTIGAAPGGFDEPFASYVGALVFESLSCFGSFTLHNCNPGAYTFDFNLAPPTIGGPTLDLAPGASYDFLLGTFSPTGGSAPPGTYRSYNAALIFQFSGLNANGDQIFAQFGPTTCPTQDDACAFTRVVANGPVVPEPATVALLGTGLLALGGVAARRRTAR